MSRLISNYPVYKNLFWSARLKGLKYNFFSVWSFRLKVCEVRTRYSTLDEKHAFASLAMFDIQHLINE